MKSFKETKILILIAAIFAAFYFLPVDSLSFRDSILEGFSLLKWYAQEHVILCLIPAFFIAGAISVFVSQDSVIRYFGYGAKKWISYSIASVSGTVLAVCSCTILPLFAGIYKRGAGLGPAVAFLYSGPAINVLAIILTARILGVELGVARTIGAVVFSVVIGLIMSLIYRKEEKERAIAHTENTADKTESVTEARHLWKDLIYFASMIGILVFANWGKPLEQSGFFYIVYSYKWLITGMFAVMLGLSLTGFLKVRLPYVLAGAAGILATVYFLGENHQLVFLLSVAVISVILFISKGEAGDWLESTWSYAKLIMPLLALGVFVSGFLFGSPDNPKGLIPNEWISSLVGGNSLFSNLFASVFGAFMYFATLTEVPILQGLMISGMGKGPALALLLAGPALSLPSMLVIKSVIGTEKTVVYVGLVIVMSTISGYFFGLMF
ncbi:MAG: permease [Ignavibacteria bacterium]|nr:permease [Ignavibacteria bacterium]